MLSGFRENLHGYTLIDLFAGLGGFRLALESLGAEAIYASEWDKHAQDTYEANFGVRPDGDITKVDEKAIPDFDILCAGFPCQAFSISGKQRGFEDTRGTLFFDVARIVKEKNPSVVFLENVKNFASHDGGNTLRVVEDTLKDLGYRLHYKVLNPVRYGVPQRRERIYMIAFGNDIESESFTFPKEMPLSKHVADILLPPAETAHLLSTRTDVSLTKADDTYSNSVPIRLGQVGKGGQGERIYSTKGVGITLSANGGGAFAKTGGYLTQEGVRKLHPRECARLMTFPENYKIHPSPSQAYKQFGNSVIVEILQLIGVEIGKVLKLKK